VCHVNSADNPFSLRLDSESVSLSSSTWLSGSDWLNHWHCTSMWCPIHNHCTCYAAYAASFPSLPLPPSPIACQWYGYPFDVQCPTSHSGGNTHGTIPLHNSYLEPLALSHAQVCFTISYTSSLGSQAYPKLD
jgi:hypothetical protein